MHPHGLHYRKPNAGVAIAGQEFDGNSVPPGQNWSQVDTTVHNFAVIRS